MKRLAVTLALALAACTPAAPSSDAASAILITLDTTRADALGCYGREPAVTPHLDRLATESVLYEQAYTVAPLTLPSHCSMMTGLYPPRHTVRDNAMWPLPGSAHTLAERAQSAGIETAGFVAAAVLDPALGIAQGFDVYDAPAATQGQEGLHGERVAADVVAAALAWAAERDPSRPFFLWVHFFDPHTPYEPPADFRGPRFGDDPYLGELAYTDAQIGVLLDGLERRGMLADTTLIVMGDHGEAFGEHRERVHGDFVYETTIRVPLLIRRADGRRAGERSDELVSAVDLYPTLCAALGLDPGDTDGHDLLAPVPADRGVYFETYAGYFAQGWSPLAGWRDARGKYLHSSEPEFYDVAADPGEQHDLIDERADELRRYRVAISDVAAREPLEADAAGALDEDVLATIRGLGYAALGGATTEVPHPLAPSDRPSPRSMAEWSLRTIDGMNLLLAGRYPEAQRVFEEVLAVNPLNFMVLQNLAFCLMRQNKTREAIPRLRLLLAEGPKKADWYLQLAVCLEREGRGDEAVEALENAVELEPTARYYDALVRMLRALGRDDEAARRARERDAGSR